MEPPALEFNRSLLGKEVASGTFLTVPERVQAFCWSIGETDPVYLDEGEARRHGYPGLPVPPAFLVLFLRDLPRPDIGLPFRTRLLASQTLEPLAPVYAGEALTARTRLKDVYTKTGRTGRMAFVVWETEFASADGHPVARVRDTFMLRPRDASGPFPPGFLGDPGSRPLPPTPEPGEKRAFEEVEVGDPIGPEALVATSEAVREFCRAWGLPPENRFTSLEVARREGFPGPLVPGNMSLALLARFLRRWAPSHSLRSLDVIFRRPIPHNRPVALQGIVTATALRDGQGVVEADLFIEGGETPLVTGRAVLTLPLRSPGGAGAS